MQKSLGFQDTGDMLSFFWVANNWSYGHPDQLVIQSDTRTDTLRVMLYPTLMARQSPTLARRAAYSRLHPAACTTTKIGRHGKVP